MMQSSSDCRTRTSSLTKSSDQSIFLNKLSVSCGKRDWFVNRICIAMSNITLPCCIFFQTSIKFLNGVFDRTDIQRRKTKTVYQQGQFSNLMFVRSRLGPIASRHLGYVITSRVEHKKQSSSELALFVQIPAVLIGMSLGNFCMFCDVYEELFCRAQMAGEEIPY